MPWQIEPHKLTDGPPPEPGAVLGPRQATWQATWQQQQQLDAMFAKPRAGQHFTCSHDKAYVAILITIIPLGAMLTLLIVLALMAFHKSIRSTKIYDNCTSQSANYVYHIEIRTGDTSASYTRRKATLSIDMFDENQATLARIAVPGHVIFGRKDAPIECADDDKFSELRVTRLWLYRATRLRRVATIRLTHTCSEPEARIMIYGLELRTDDPDRPRLFFPVMSYVTAYGSVGRPNACFDSDPLGTISLMGQFPDSATISEHLGQLDYAILTLFFCALTLYLSTLDLFADSFHEHSAAVFKGAVLGCISFTSTFAAGLLMRYLVKHNYSRSVGRGPWALAYHTSTGLLAAGSLVLWLYTTYVGYKQLCSNHFGIWMMSVCAAVIESLGFAILCATVAWMLAGQAPVYAEQFVLPDEQTGGGGGLGENRTLDIGKPTMGSGGGGGRLHKSNRQQRSPSSDTLAEHGGRRPAGPGAQAPPWPTMAAGHSGAATPTPPLLLGVPHLAQHQLPGGYHQGPANMYGQPQPGPYMMMPAPGGAQTTYKVAPFTPPTAGYQPAYPDQAGHYNQGAQSPFYAGAQNQPAAGPVAQQATPPTVFHTMQLSKPPVGGAGAGPKQANPGQPTPFQPTYGQQMGAPGATNKLAAGGAGRPKTSSQESTGSTYYQQLMKNKGGVKSISQYGELLKKNKK